MRVHHRHTEDVATPDRNQTAAVGGGDDDGRATLRNQAAALLAAADDAITRALSRDSAEFLAQNRQSGGQ